MAIHNKENRVYRINSEKLLYHHKTLKKKNHLGKEENLISRFYTIFKMYSFSITTTKRTYKQTRTYGKYIGHKKYIVTILEKI